MRRVQFGLLGLLWCAMEAAAQTPAPVPGNDEIRRILVERVDVQKQSIGIVVGVIDPHGRRIVAYGSLDKGDPRKLDGDTLFEIGSITKVFTALLAADMAQRGAVKLDDPVAKFLPATVKMPERNGRQITLADLATHTSGLPRLPTNMRSKDPMNPYADYTEEQLFSFLSSYELPRDIGVRYEYSNLGFGLLGLALARRAGTSYESLVVSRICDPLHMDSTRITLSDALRTRLAVGHTSDLVRTGQWDAPTLAGAGALSSSANDLLTFLAAMMDYTHNPLAAAQKLASSTTRPTGRPFENVGLAWEIDTRGGGKLIWKNGGTGGYRTFIGYSPERRVGVVALSNAEGGSTPDDIGFHLLDARYPLLVPLTAANSGKEQPVDRKVLEGYVGYYQLQPNLVIHITLDGDQLIQQATGQGPAAIYPKSKTEFFLKVVDAQITFETDSEGKTTALVLHQNGRDMRGKHISDSEARDVEDTLARRFKEQKADPRSEALIRQQVAELQRKQPNFDIMTPDFAAIAQSTTSQTEAMIADLGALQTVTFKGVGPGGADIYELKFANGTLEWRLLLDAPGKIAGQGIRLKR